MTTPKGEGGETEGASHAALEDALRALAMVDVPPELTSQILARTANGESAPLGFLGFGKKQWLFAGASFSVWALTMQGVFSWMLGGITTL